jgi:hypothetical protein
LRVPVALLTGFLIWFGFFPQTFVQIVTPALRTYIGANK